MEGDLHVFVLLGQSNMVGRGYCPNQQCSNDIFVYRQSEGDMVREWQELKQHPIFDQRIDPRAGYCLAYDFAKEYMRCNQTCSVGFIPLAVGGSPLSLWDSSSDYYNQSINIIRSVKNGILKGILWHQGETDATDENLAKSYETRLIKFFINIRQQLELYDLVIIVGELGNFLANNERFPYYDIINKATKNVANSLARVGYVTTENLIDKGDHLHFNTDSLIELGKRYASAYFEVLTE